MKHPITCLMLSLLLPFTAFAAQGDFTATDIGEGFTALQGKGGNILVQHGSDGKLVVDNDFAMASEALQKALDKIGGKNTIPYVINTHWHGDHVGNNEYLASQASIIAHDNVLSRVSTQQVSPRRTTEALAESGWPSITFNDTLTLRFNDQTVQMVHYPNGHTDGDSVIYFPSANIVHMGDLYFNHRFPFVDTNSGGDALHFLANVEAVLARIDDDTTVIPGHGPVASNKSELAEFQNMLNQTITETQAMHEAGINESDAIAKGFSGDWSDWNWSFVTADKWMSMIYASLDQRGGDTSE
ncbi:MAG: MBL fold metallo-hydrolase [Pseudomonadales bacterium]